MAWLFPRSSAREHLEQLVQSGVLSVKNSRWTLTPAFQRHGHDVAQLSNKLSDTNISQPQQIYTAAQMIPECTVVFQPGN